jgi:signal transduction histidine kinase
MSNGLLQHYNRSQFRLSIALLLGGALYIILNLTLQYHEKKQFLNQQATYVARAVRNDLIGGNQFYVYEQCRSLLSDMSIEKLSISRNQKIYCDEKKYSHSFFVITTMVPVSYNPQRPQVGDNLVGSVSLGVRSDSIFLSAIFSLIFFVLLLYYLYKAQKKSHQEIRNDVIEPLNLLADIMRTDPHNINEVETLRSKVELSDIKVLFTSYLTLTSEIEAAEKKIREQSRQSAILDVSKQVAHDIRSPLSALNMVMTTLTTLPEDERILVRNAISRINDIANNLLQKGKQENLSLNSQSNSIENNLTVELIPVLVDMLVSEKRMQYREFSGLNIEVELRDSFGAFSLINSAQLKCVLSNLVNNAVESFEKQVGCVLISVVKINRHVVISITDNGKGIPAHLIEKLGKEQLSFGKDASDKSGSGLGLYHAKQTILHLGGSLEILSTEGKGTTISIKLNLADSPLWFTDRIDLTDKNLVISLDDDLSVHQIWASRLNIIANDKIIHKQFQSGEVFKKFVQEKLDDVNKIQFLIDYELLSQGKTGLDIIEELDISQNSILVTSRYEEASIQERAGVIGLKVLPKSLAGFVPFEIKEAKIKYDIILLDDDQLVRMTWEIKAKQKGKSILSLASTSELWAIVGELDKENVFYIDVHLSKSENGEQVTKELFKLGYLNLYLATGYDSDQFPHVTWIKGVVGKTPVI